MRNVCSYARCGSVSNVWVCGRCVHTADLALPQWACLPQPEQQCQLRLDHVHGAARALGGLGQNLQGGVGRGWSRSGHSPPRDPAHSPCPLEPPPVQLPSPLLPPLHPHPHLLLWQHGEQLQQLALASFSPHIGEEKPASANQVQTVNLVQTVLTLPSPPPQESPSPAAAA